MCLFGVIEGKLIHLAGLKLLRKVLLFKSWKKGCSRAPLTVTRLEGSSYSIYVKRSIASFYSANLLAAIISFSFPLTFHFGKFTPKKGKSLLPYQIYSLGVPSI